MRVALVFMIIPAAFMVSVGLATSLGIYQRVPIVPLLIAAVSLFFLFRLIRDRFTWPRLAANLLAWALVGGFAWFTLVFSEYDDRPLPVAVGDTLTTPLNEIILTGTDGQPKPWPAVSAGAKATLLVFFRGYW